jgi:signal transduction histidine kinase
VLRCLLFVGSVLGLLVPPSAVGQGPPPVRISQVWVRIDTAFSDQREVARQGAGVRVPAGTNRLVVAFEAPHEPAATFAYRLAGRERTWLVGQPAQRVIFADLEGGTYVFEVRNERVPAAVARLRVQVDRSFYQHWWFTPLLFLYALLVLGIVIYLVLQYRFRQQLRLQRVRNGIASDLHDDVGSTLGSVAYFAETIRRRLLKHQHPANAEVLPVLDKLIANAHDTVESMRGIVWAINPENDEAGAFLQKLRAFAQELLGSRNVACRVDWDEAVERIRWMPEQRRNLFLLVKESLHNVAKHAAATTVRVVIRQEGERVHVEISDDGRGFDSAAAYAGTGLKTLHARAAELGGHLAVQSVPGRGTSVEAVFPVTR